LAAGECLALRGPLAFEADEREHAVDGQRRRVKTSEMPYHFLNGQLVKLATRLQHDTDACAPAGRCVGGIGAKHGDLAGAPLTETFEDLDHGGLAGTVGAKECEDFAMFDFEVDAAERGELSIAFLEAMDLDGR
jgi:hypothetical protein